MTEDEKNNLIKAINLNKRIKLGHLPKNCSLESYEAIIREIIFNPKSQVYLFSEENNFYPTITCSINNTLWLVIFSTDGIMETAFPPSNSQKYLSNNYFIYVGTLKELL